MWPVPRNSAYQPIPGDQAQILGKVVGVLRLLGTSQPVQPGRDEEFGQLHTDHFAVWDRSRAYATAVRALLRART
ncbi:hypothetical protein JCM4814A_93480 [Streptomyces phaeofaciens JCM 4814]|uniref:Uncharacterized protein n=1 Tax=Streptomyces phaeofaciens TaxID=68254 RepID=A0A918HLB3_9ACTN|nr:hypothetical protein GCM10010226_56820 [Streptomyces phaeofaciens]